MAEIISEQAAPKVSEAYLKNDIGIELFYRVWEVTLPSDRSNIPRQSSLPKLTSCLSMAMASTFLDISRSSVTSPGRASRFLPLIRWDAARLVARSII